MALAYTMVRNLITETGSAVTKIRKIHFRATYEILSNNVACIVLGLENTKHTLY